MFDGIYTVDGAPTCMGGKPMEYVRTDPKTGHHLYRCPPGGCDRKSRIKGYSTCDDSHWEDPEQNIRLLGGAIRRGSPEWRRKYRKRWSIERVCSRWRTHGRLRNHFFRDRVRIHLHMQLRMLALQATILTKLIAESARLRRNLGLQATAFFPTPSNEGRRRSADPVPLGSMSIF